MSNVNRPHNYVDNDDDYDLGLHEMESESTAIGQTDSSSYLSVSSPQPTPVGQLASDERTDGIDEVIASLSRTPRLSSSNDEFDVASGETRPWTEESVFAYVFAANRDEQSSGRIAHPSDGFQTILLNLLSSAVVRLIFAVISNAIPFGVPDTEPHTMVLPVVNLYREDISVDIENGDRNEDATVDNGDPMNLTTNEIVRSNLVIVRDSMATESTDDVTSNINPITSTAAQDNNHRNEQIMEDTSETDNQNNLNNNDDSERGQVFPHPERDVNNEIPDHVQTNTPPTPILTPRTESSEQAEEIVSPLAGPTDTNTETTADPARLLATDLDISSLNAHQRKQSSPLDVPEEVGENKHAQ